MNTLALDRAGAHNPLATLLVRHRVWALTAAGMAALGIACVLAATVDARLFNGVSVWTKPAKFATSIAVYFATLAWFAPLLPADYFARLRGRVLTWLPVGCALFEIVYITFQGAVGEASHFNFSTTFHNVMFSLMGLGAVLLVTVCLWMGVAILRARGAADPYVLAVGVGLVLTCVLGLATGQTIGMHGGHWVGGAATDAGGVAIFNWVRDGGDLRVAHFFGMHAMQALPLAAWLAGRAPLRGAARNLLAHATVVAVACAWSALTVVTLLQALRGVPFAA